MGIEHTGIVGTGSETRVHVHLDVERAGRIVGKRGTTMKAIRHLLGLALENHGGPELDVDVNDPRPKEARGRDRERRRDEGTRGGDRGRRPAGKSAHEPETLQLLAQKAGQKALETGRTITLNLALNSYDRRIVHVEVATIDGVESTSIEKEGEKYVQVAPVASE